MCILICISMCIYIIYNVYDVYPRVAIIVIKHPKVARDLKNYIQGNMWWKKIPSFWWLVFFGRHGKTAIFRGLLFNLPIGGKLLEEQNCARCGSTIFSGLHETELRSNSNSKLKSCQVSYIQTPWLTFHEILHASWREPYFISYNHQFKTWVV